MELGVPWVHIPYMAFFSGAGEVQPLGGALSSNFQTLKR